MSEELVKGPIELSIDGKGDFEIVSAVGASVAPRTRKGTKHQRDLAVAVEGAEHGYDVASTRRIGPGLYEVVLTKAQREEPSEAGHVELGLVDVGDAVANEPMVDAATNTAAPTQLATVVDGGPEGSTNDVGDDEELSLPGEVAIALGDVGRLPDHLVDPELLFAAPPVAAPAPAVTTAFANGENLAVGPKLSAVALADAVHPPLLAPPNKKRWYQRKAKGPTLVIPTTPRPGPLAIAADGPPMAPLATTLQAVPPTSSAVRADPRVAGDVALSSAPVEIDVSTGLPRTAPPALAVSGAKDLGRNWRGQKVTEDGHKELPERPAMALWDYFAEVGLATAEHLDAAFGLHVETGVTVMEALVAVGACDESALVQAASTFSGLAICDLPRAELDPAALDLLPESIAREHRIFPLRILPDDYIVALAEPSEKLHSLLTQASGSHVTMMVARPTDIVAAIDQNYHALFGINELVEEFEADEGTRRRANAVTPAEVDADNAPIVRLVNRILSQAMRDGASDVHIEPADEVVRVRSRVDGVLKVVLVLPAAMGLGLVSRIKIMAEMNIVERRRPQDGTFTIQLDGRAVDVRVATVATIFGESCVLRLLDKTKSLLSISDLGMAESTHATYSKMIRAPFGMVLCVGPTGSGKTTTLYASLNEISDVARNVMTIEDPVEYVFPSINQIQTNEQAGLTFATGLKSILRQDSDVVLVGEIRDVETARIAVQSTLTGHFVLSSIHATDAIGALTRFIDMGIEPFLIASSLVGLVGQRLVRRTCTSCSEPYVPTDEELDFYVQSGGPEKKVFLRGAGCNTCGHTGYKGRVGVYELVPMTPEMKRLIVGFATEQELRDLAKKQGIRSMQDEAIALISRDITTPAEVIRSIYAL